MSSDYFPQRRRIKEQGTGNREQGCCSQAMRIGNTRRFLTTLPIPHSLFPVPFFILFLTVLTGCSGLEKFDKQNITIEGKNGPVIVKAEIARSAAQQQQGLMYRKELKDGEGMLFIFDRDDILSFWMKNTLVPLSIAYIAQDGRILEIHDMEPGNLNPVKSSRSARYALEVPQGWFDRANLAPGDKLDVNGVKP